MPNTCEYCSNVGAEKGVDDFGHEHCRLCPDWDDNGSYRGRTYHLTRMLPATGDIWTVWCNGDRMTVKAVRNREEPAAFRAPEGVFRRACRMITVIMGAEDSAQSFLVEELLLRSASEYFENALKNDNFTEGATGRVELKDEDPEIFGLLNEYLHLGSIHETQPLEERHEVFRTLSKIPESPTMAEYCRLWLLADYLRILELKNYAMWRLLTMTDNARCRMNIEDVEDIYARAPVDSVLRKFLIHLCVWRDQDEELELTEDPPRDMMRELIRELRRSRMASGQTNPLMDVRYYYEKEEDSLPPPVEEEVVEAEAGQEDTPLE